MPEQFRDWLPDGEKMPAVKKGGYQDWVPPDNWNASEGRVMVQEEKPSTSIATVETTNDDLRHAKEYACKKCGATFPMFHQVAVHYKESHPKVEE